MAGITRAGDPILTYHHPNFSLNPKEQFRVLFFSEKLCRGNATARIFSRLFLNYKEQAQTQGHGQDWLKPQLDLWREDVANVQGGD